ncbi:dTDP-4-dehydrorhamnose reductase [Sphingomonas sp.]|uniref:dTDP-4-dehydrorhamnose reductase n=1 Tax=Sphingomonas sp. TaxID=28214 RepID=UPI002601036C|nr:dTDP-4-dehydrorhamnose reductase [Sphingomonas sp.]MBV9528569.1 dTDP-4-dehydrorhamnose reductase [Sphingomonas sp.]
MRLLVTGAHGQVALSLKERGAGRSDISLMFASRPQTDLSVPGSVAAAIRDASPDMVVNAAAFTNVDLAEAEREHAWRINAEAAGEVAAAAADVDAAIIQLSTDYVFDGTRGRPWREDDAIRPLNVYGTSKAAGEDMVRRANPRHLIIRTSWVVSPFGRNFAKTIVEAARSRDVLRVVDDQRGRPTSALDLADAILAMADGVGTGAVNLGQTYHVAGAGAASWFELASEIMDECRRAGAPSAGVVPVTSAEWPTAALRPRNSVLDCSRFEADFGTRLPGWRISVRNIVSRLLAGHAE